MNIVLGNQIKRKLDFIIKRLRRRLSKRIEIKVFGSSEDEIRVSYVINLDRQMYKWVQFQNEAKYQKVKEDKNLLDFCQRIPATDARTLKLDEFTSSELKQSYNLQEQYYIDPDPRLLKIIRNKNISIDLTKEEIAVALSHIRVWKKIVEENLLYALILEDDVFFERGFAESINQIWKELPDKRDDGVRFDFLYLSFHEVNHGTEKESFSKNLFRPKRGLWWLSGYVLSIEGAKKLLRELPVSGPVDLWMNHKFAQLDVYCSTKSIINQRADLKSDNKYSILPILSQAGVQSDKTHLLLEQKKGRNPVFVINIGDDDTFNLGNALNILGYRCCVNKWSEFSEKVNCLIESNEPMLFDAYIGFKSFINHYKTLDTLYPDAVFIIIGNYFSGKKHSEIFDYFLRRTGKLLDLTNNYANSWEKICKFLNCKIPKTSFPNYDNYSKYIPELDVNESIMLPIKLSEIKLLEHDVHPWIIPIENLKSFGITGQDRKNARKVGYYTKILDDNFNEFDESKWRILNNSFPSNLAQFTKRNISLINDSGFRLTVTKEKIQQKKYSSASIATINKYHYGRYDVRLKPIKVDGIITAFFLHRNDPWQEIDFEFLGNDTTKVLFNVYYNPGVNGSVYNYGNRGTPVLISLDFDASQDYHDYAIEWEPHEIRWYIDNNLVYVRANWEPTPIPEYPMQFFINTWPSRSEELVGAIMDDMLPQSCCVRNVKIQSWSLDTIIEKKELH
jgi:GR25 family glycosyltransferase involved in LPS biosynthesis